MGRKNKNKSKSHAEEEETNVDEQTQQTEETVTSPDETVPTTTDEQANKIAEEQQDEEPQQDNTEATAATEEATEEKASDAVNAEEEPTAAPVAESADTVEEAKTTEDEAPVETETTQEQTEGEAAATEPVVESLNDENEKEAGVTDEPAAEETSQAAQKEDIEASEQPETVDEATKQLDEVEETTTAEVPEEDGEVAESQARETTEVAGTEASPTEDAPTDATEGTTERSEEPEAAQNEDTQYTTTATYEEPSAPAQPAEGDDIDDDDEVEEQEEAVEPIAPEVLEVPTFDTESATVAEPTFNESEQEAMNADAAAIEAAETDAEKATRTRTAELRKAIFTNRALKRQTHARASEARTVGTADATADLDALNTKAAETEREAAELEAAIANSNAAKERLTPKYHGALKALYMLERFDNFLVRLSEHVKEVNNEANKPQGSGVEQSTLDHVRDLVSKRNAELEHLEAIKARIRKTAADLRKGQQIEPRSKIPSIAGDSGSNYSAASGPTTYGRSSVAREDGAAVANAAEDVAELRGYNEEVGKQVEDLTEALQRLTKERSAYSVKLSLTKAANRKAEASMQDEFKQKSLRLRADTKAIEELHRTNAALISTIETLMHQLNNEYYGAGDRPTLTVGGANKQQRPKTAGTSLAIEDRKGTNGVFSPAKAGADNDKSPAPRRR